MTVDLSKAEAAEVVLQLRHMVDAAWQYTGTDFSQELSLSVIAKLCDKLGMKTHTPWDEQVYEKLMEIAEQ